MALEVLGKLEMSIPVCGMVKDDHHRTRGLYYNNVELPIDTHSEGFHLITRVQDEAHRFAIEYHKSLRGKKEIHSILDDIPGIGPKRRLAIVRLKIVGTERERVIGKELEIRRTLSESHLKSSAFVVTTQQGADGIPQSFHLSGAGWGHGVGLCQIGAAMMGEKGYDHEAILRHYYPGATLKTLYKPSIEQ